MRKSVTFSQYYSVPSDHRISNQWEQDKNISLLRVYSSLKHSERKKKYDLTEFKKRKKTEGKRNKDGSTSEIEVKISMIRCKERILKDRKNHYILTLQI